jgi:hypothetical protein
LFPRFVPKADLKIRYALCLGGLVLSAFLILLISGLLLSFYYRSNPKEAYGSIVLIEEKVFMGRFLRWGAPALEQCISCSFAATRALRGLYGRLQVPLLQLVRRVFKRRLACVDLGCRCGCFDSFPDALYRLLTGTF